MRDQQILSFLYENSWAILDAKWHEIQAVIALHASGGKLDLDQIKAITEAAHNPQRSPQGIAVLPLFGPMVQRANLMTEVSGGTSTEMFGKEFMRAVESPQVGTIVIDIDSPGGTIAGSQPLADLIFEARGVKPIIAIANSMAASASLLVASQADEFVAAPGSILGAVGVFAQVQNPPEAASENESTIEVIRAGRLKAEEGPNVPLSDDGRARIQETVDEQFNDMVASIARGRGTTVTDVVGNFGEGAVLAPRAALDVGMIDAIETMDQLLARLGAVTATGGPRAEVGATVSSVQEGWDHKPEVAATSTNGDTTITVADDGNRSMNVTESEPVAEVEEPEAPEPDAEADTSETPGQTDLRRRRMRMHQHSS